VSKRGWFTLGVIVLLGIWFMVVGYEFLDKENALWQKKAKAAKEELKRCEARNARYKQSQSRVLIAPPYMPDLEARRWTRRFDAVHPGQTEQEVEATLGWPDYTRCDLNKAGDRFEGSVWRYTMFTPPGISSAMQNDTIQIEFGRDGRVEDKSMMNLQPKASPSQNATATATSTPSGTATPVPSPDVSATPAATPSSTPQ
jgi:hypothetical protein